MPWVHHDAERLTFGPPTNRDIIREVQMLEAGLNDLFEKVLISKKIDKLAPPILSTASTQSGHWGVARLSLMFGSLEVLV
jgi:hypothetical protein